MPDASSSEVDSRGQLQQACSELRLQLRAGQPCSAEKLLSTYSQLSADPNSALELILEEYRLRRELGQARTPHEWLERFPSLGGWLNALLHGVDVSEASSLWDVAPTLGEQTVFLGDNQQQSQATVLPRRLGHHELLEEIGRGGMGVVYKSRHTILDRIYALKIIGVEANVSPDAVQRFLNEARAASDLEHPNIVRIYETGRENQQHYFTMAYLSGGNLVSRKREFSGPRAAAVLVHKLARAAHFAHEHGIIHRDLKPGNVLLDQNGEPRITDFGLAKLADAPDDPVQAGRPMGTPSYMSPEQASGRPADIGPQSDVWSLGVILYELLTGHPPFSAATTNGIKRRILHDAPIRPCALRPDLDPWLEAIILKTLDKDPQQRFASAGAMADDLARAVRLGC